MNLRSFDRNRIAIDALNLPVDADVPMTEATVVPGDRSGVVVDFTVKTEVKAAVVILVDPSSKFVAAGSRGRLERTGETFVVGYDGRAYIKGLDSVNTVTIDAEDRHCHATFQFTPHSGEQVVLGPVACR